MFRVFTGNNRPQIQSEIKKIFGQDYEVFDGENLKIPDLYNICQGNSLFAETRKILIKDLTPARKSTSTETEKTAETPAENSADIANIFSTDPYEILANFVDTKHEIIIWESNVPNRKSYRDFIKNKKVEHKKIDQPKVDEWASLRIFDIAHTDGKKAVAELEKLIRTTETGGEVKMLDPYLMVGAFATSALKKFELHAGAKERKVLKELSKLDIKMKSSTIDAWTLVKAFLLRLETI